MSTKRSMLSCRQNERDKIIRQLRSVKLHEKGTRYWQESSRLHLLGSSSSTLLEVPRGPAAVTAEPRGCIAQRARKHLGCFGRNLNGVKHLTANNVAVLDYGGDIGVAERSQNRRNAWRLIGPVVLFPFVIAESRANDAEETCIV